MTALTEPQYVPALEEIENVSISGNSFDAEQQSGGGAVNITIKSGTNAVHGVLFEDHTDQHMQAYPYCRIVPCQTRSISTINTAAPSADRSRKTNCFTS